MVMEPASAFAVMMAARGSAVRRGGDRSPAAAYGHGGRGKATAGAAFVEHEGFALGACDGDDVVAMAG